MPLLVTEGLRVIERSTQHPPESPLAGMHATLLAGFCLLAGAMLLAMQRPWPIWTALFVVAAVLIARGKGGG
jgi:uncharacterized protein (DUF983 family)